MLNGQVDQHMHLRRRAHRGNSVHYAYPSSNRLIRFVDELMYVVGVIGPLVSIPQLVEIYGRGNVQGLSLLTWSGYVVLSLLWLLYGVVHREKPIIITQALWFLINFSVTLGIFLYQ